MPSEVNDIITGTDVGSALIPNEYATQIIQDATQQSAIMQFARQIPMSTRTRTQPVLGQKPIAYWVGGDTGLKQTTKQMWDNITITAEELAAIVPIPENLIDDASVPLWGEVQPRLAEAIGEKLDAAALFGTDKPASFPTGLIPAAITAGNKVVQGTNVDLAADVAALGKLLAAQGFAANGFCAQPGLNWELIGLRNAQGTPIYTPAIAGTAPAGLYGFPLHELTNGAWDNTKAVLAAVDWSNVVYAVRKDITYKLLDQAVISDDDGKVILNLAQQDAVALRVTFRAGIAIANPVTSLQSDKTKRYPAGVITPAGA
jgi:HK97 family phage major capsid protein